MKHVKLKYHSKTSGHRHPLSVVDRQVEAQASEAQK